MHDIHLKDITGRAESSFCVCGVATSPVRRVRVENLVLTLDRWTRYPGARFDDRPTTALPAIEPHNTPGIVLRYAEEVRLKNCRVQWGARVPDYFSHALEAETVAGLKTKNFRGAAAHPQRDQAIWLH